MGIQTEMFETLHIAVFLDLEEVPAVSVQKSKLMAILIKLLENACQSLDAVTSDREKRISVSLSATDDSDIRIQVQDNGVGIEQEDLADLFYRAFSKNQAFSLHFCASAMTEMGGNISAQSDGPDHGATFVLTFPCKRDPLVEQQ